MEGDMTAAAATIGATDIREVMKSQGPIVNTVILRCRSSAYDDNDDDGKGDSKPAAIEKAEEQSGAAADTNAALLSAKLGPFPRDGSPPILPGKGVHESRGKEEFTKSVQQAYCF